LPKNIVIAEGTQGKTFTAVEKIRTKLQGGGTCNWIPEDEAGEYTNLKNKTIRENGEYLPSADNCTGYSKVTVNVKTKTKSIRITENGTYNAADESVDGYKTVTVNVAGGGGGGGTNIGDKTIKMNGIYRAAADGLDGYGTVTVSIMGLTPQFGKMRDKIIGAKNTFRAGDMTGGV
jgi:hypothetical protein